jgi:hypothetical protein
MQPVARKRQKLNYNNGNGGVSYVVRAENYLEDNFEDPVSCQLRVQFCTGGCEEKSQLQECSCEEKTLCVISGVCNSVRLL